MEAGAALAAGFGVGCLTPAPAPTDPPWTPLLPGADDEAAGEAAAWGLLTGGGGLGAALNMSSIWAVLDCALGLGGEPAAGALKKSARLSGVAGGVALGGGG